MYIDYHMHLEYGEYTKEYASQFIAAARKHNLNEIGFAEHSHTFIEFRSLYEDELLLDDSPLGQFQSQWLQKNKFRYHIQDYLDFIADLNKLGFPIKAGLEVCNFHDQQRVQDILAPYGFDYIIGSVHYLDGQGYDFSQMKYVWEQYPLPDIYRCYTSEVCNLAASGLYDILGHPFNIRLFRHLPDFDVTPFLEQTIKALQAADMAIDVNTGTYYRYPIKEISPYPDFLNMANHYGLPLILSSDAHHPEDCGRHIAAAAAYARSCGYDKLLTFEKRQRHACLL